MYLTGNTNSRSIDEGCMCPENFYSLVPPPISEKLELQCCPLKFGPGKMCRMIESLSWRSGSVRKVYKIFYHKLSLKSRLRHSSTPSNFYGGKGAEKCQKIY